MIVDEAEADHRIVSRAKYAAALRKISRSARGSMFSRRSRLQLDPFALAQPVGIGAAVLGNAGCFDQLPNVSRLIPRLTATSLIDLPEPNTSSTGRDPSRVQVQSSSVKDPETSRSSPMTSRLSSELISA